MLQGAIIGAVVGLIVGLFVVFFRKKDGPDENDTPDDDRA